MKTFSMEEISRSDGKDGRPSLVVVDGQAYDVSTSKRWVGGLHMRRHQAGADLSSDLRAAPHGLEMLERVELVGKVIESTKEKSSGIKGIIEAFLVKYPFFRRHPHPAIVHFPLGLLLVAPLMEVAAVFTDSSATEWAAYLMLAIGSITIPGAIITGYLTWWLNYEALDTTIIKTKRYLAWIALLLAITALLTRSFLISDPLRLTDLLVAVYLVDMVAVSALIGCIGFLGGKLTFPYD